MTLHVEKRGTGAPVALLHGFTQNRRCWGAFGDALADRFAVSLVDLPGHGLSLEDEADLDRAGELVLEAVPTQQDSTSLVGYSFGGRVALHAALQVQRGASSIPIDRVVLIGATGGLDTDQDRAERREADELLAQRLELQGLDAFLDRWLALPLFAGISDEQNMLLERQRNRLEGLAASLRNCGTGSQRPLWQELGELSLPVTVIAGELDTKFLALGERLVSTIGANAKLEVIEGAGHACHLEAPAATAAVVTAALIRSSPAQEA